MHIKALLALAIGIGASFWFGVLAVHKWLLIRRASRWDTTMGEVIESGTFKNAEGKTHFKVCYRFKTGTRELVGDSPRISGDWFLSNGQQQAFVDRFLVGTQVPVYFDRSRPERNCVDRTDRTGVYVLATIAVGAALLSGLLIWLNAVEIRAWIGA
jgi:hypothetical protein